LALPLVARSKAQKFQEGAEIYLKNIANMFNEIIAERSLKARER
jgi:hypothetical protein